MSHDWILNARHSRCFAVAPSVLYVLSRANRSSSFAHLSPSIANLCSFAWATFSHINAMSFGCSNVWKAAFTVVVVMNTNVCITIRCWDLLSSVHTSNNFEAITCYKSNDSFDKVETNWTCSICFDFIERIVHTSNNVEATFDFIEATFDFVERIVRRVASDNVASTLLMVWTRL